MASLGIGARWQFRAALTAAAVCVGLAFACNGGSDKATGTTRAISAIVVVPDSATLVVGGTQALIAQPEDASGDAIPGVHVVWAAADTTIAAVDTGGTITGRSPGTVRIAASAQGLTGFATVVVTAHPVTSVTVSPNPATVPLNGTTTLTATLADALGDTFVGQTVTWSSSDTTTVSVTSSTGQTQIVTGKKGGSATVAARSTNGVTGTTIVTVTRPVSFVQVTPNPLLVRTGFTVQAMAQAFDANGDIISGTTFAWTTMSGGSVARVNASTGLVTGVAAGSDSVYAQAGGKQGGTPATVLADPVTAVSISGNNSISYVQTELLTATCTDSARQVVPNSTVTWSSNPAGRVSPTTGQTTTVAPQSSDVGAGIQVTATCGGVSATVTVPVTAPFASRVTLTPTPDSTVRGGTPITLTATALSGTSQIPGTIALGISDLRIGQLSSSSVQSGQTFTVTPGSTTGTASVQASINGHTGTASITVYAQDTITTQGITISESGRHRGKTSATLTVLMRNADGTLDLTSQVTWTGSDGGTYLSFAPNPSSNAGGSSSTTVSATGAGRVLSTTITVTATTTTGLTATTQITVKP